MALGMPNAERQQRPRAMHILILIAAVWGGFFLLSLAFAAANSRKHGATTEPTMIDFRVHPLLLPNDGERLKPLRDIITSKLQPPAGRKGKSVPNAGKPVIFVVDDDPDILGLIKNVLDLEGFEVRSFTNPEEALKEFESSSRRPEMVVTDYCMEPMNGLEFITRCRQTDPNVKTIVISGMVHEDDLAELPEKTNHFLSKPFKVSSLIETLNDSLAKAQN
jgi:CheY-like chemotaxis protein